MQKLLPAKLLIVAALLSPVTTFAQSGGGGGGGAGGGSRWRFCWWGFDGGRGQRPFRWDR
jgi:hypothetical protein